MPDAYPGASVLCEPAQSKCTWTCHKSHFVWNFKGKVPDAYPGANVLCEPAQSKCTHLQGKCQTLIPGPAFCASLRSRNAHGHVTRAILCRILQEKCRTLILGPVFCASLHSRNAHGHATRAILCGILQEKCLHLARKTAQTAFFPLPFCGAKPCQSSFLDEAGSCFMQLLQTNKVDILLPTMC